MRPAPRASVLPLGALTPMLDTLFLLLFALLVSQAEREVRAEQRAEEVRVELPTVEHAGAAADAATPRIALAIDAASRVTAAPDGAPIATPADLDTLVERRLAALDVAPRAVLVELRADRDARHGVVAALLQHLRLAGFVDVELLAEGGASAAGFDAPGADGEPAAAEGGGR